MIVLRCSELARKLPLYLITKVHRRQEFLEVQIVIHDTLSQQVQLFVNEQRTPAMKSQRIIL